ncbi:GNAT family N-acetyltransferase [Paenibacillus guangzhouensis]|uniref:GNAT family N-acetyltransferase n=1 Tax=Paenibacillus guangzhouensis TaxID=1473112 RepID=UPI00126761C4|nr:GNAT family N-acetyltransferase [Paenibacillus guangzhouensis]
MELRTYVDSDLETIANLFYDTVHTVNARDYTPKQLDAWASPDDHETRMAAWSQSLRRHITYVAVIQGCIVGFADLTPEGHLDRLYVHKDAQGQGVASTLVHRLEEEAIRLKLSEIDTDASITAKPFFERMGYTIVQSQTVERKGVQLVNYKMRKSLQSSLGESQV